MVVGSTSLEDDEESVDRQRGPVMSSSDMIWGGGERYRKRGGEGDILHGQSIVPCKYIQYIPLH